MLDEPTTALSSRETERLFALIRQLRGEGIALIYISHRMAEVYELSDRVSVLRDGSYVGTLERAELSADALVKMMVGRDLSSFYKKEHDPHGSRGPVILEVKGVTDGGRRVKPCSFQLHEGEVLGIAGLVGSGRTELARLIYGADPKAGGEVLLEGQAGRHQAAQGRARCRHRLPDRGPQAAGPVPRHVVRREHQRRRDRPRRARLGRAQPRHRQARAEAAFQALRVRAASPLVGVGSLSGGNQQKVLLSRWLEIGPKVLILDEPTRGVDIGAKSEIYRIIDELAQAGHRRDRDLQRAAGDHRHLRPGAGHARGAYRGRGRRARRASRSRRRTSWPWRPAWPPERALRARASGEDKVTTTQTARTTTTAAVASGGAGLSARQVQMRGHDPAVGMLPILVILCVGFHYLSDGRFFTPQNISIVAQQASINTVLAAGMTFVILTGGIDLSVGSILAASAMAAVICSLIPGWGLLGIPAALVTGLFFGFLNGALIAFVGLPPFIVTLGSLTAVRGLARLMGGDTTVFNPDLPFAFIGNASLARHPVAGDHRACRDPGLAGSSCAAPCWACGSTRSAATRRRRGCRASRSGRSCCSSTACRASSPGLGGVMSAARLFAANGLQIGQGYELDAIAAVILGGTSFVGGIGSIWGTLVGALIIAVLTNGLILTGVSDIWQFIIKGLVIIGAVALDRYRTQGSART